MVVAMIVTYPVTQDNVGQLPLIAELLTALGPNGQHDILVVASPDALTEAQGFMEQVSGLFRRHHLLGVSKPRLLSDTAGRNELFRQAAKAIQSGLFLPPGPWIWMERVCPTRSGWLDELYRYYITAGKTYAGVKVGSYFRAGVDATGRPLFKPHGTEGSAYFMRVGIYPEHLGKEILLDFLRDPFEMELQFLIIPRMAEYSPLIQTLWASANFRLRDGEVLGDQINESEIRKMVPVPYAPAAVIHGCVDGSMERLVLAQLSGTVVTSPSGEVAAPRIKKPRAKPAPKIELAPLTDSDAPKKVSKRAAVASL